MKKLADFESGVRGYVTGSCTIKVHFPIDARGNKEIACKHCPYLSNNERVCQLNKEIVNFSTRYVGVYCPLKIMEDTQNED